MNSSHENQTSSNRSFASLSLCDYMQNGKLRRNLQDPNPCDEITLLGDEAFFMDPVKRRADATVLLNKDCACKKPVFINVAGVPDGWYLCMGQLLGYPDSPKPTPRKKEIACFPPQPYEQLDPQEFRDGVFTVIYGAALVHLNSYNDTIDPYVAVKNGLPLEPPLAFFMKNSIKVSTDVNCDYPDVVGDPILCESTFISTLDTMWVDDRNDPPSAVLDGEVTNICKTIGLE